MGPLAFLAARVVVVVVRYRNTPTVSISTRRDATAAVISRMHPLVVRYQGEPSVDTQGGAGVHTAGRHRVHCRTAQEKEIKKWYC